MIVEFVGGMIDGLQQNISVEGIKLLYCILDEQSMEPYWYHGYLEENPNTGEPMIAYLYEPMHYSIGQGSVSQDGDFIS